MAKRNKVEKPASIQTSRPLLDDVRSLIDSARQRVAAAVNSEMVLLYWSIGERIKGELIGEGRAEYGKRIVQTLSAQLVREYGRGFEEKNLRRMIQLAETFPDRGIVVTLSRQLSWSHFIALIPLDSDLKRDFYAEMCRIERWSVRTLRDKINKMLFERTAVAKKPDALIRRELDELRETDRVTPDLTFRDPYFLDFLGLKEPYIEKDLEAAILRELESFILEMGVGFSFIARQKRITVDNEDYYIDLLFYHRKMRRLVLIDLKMDKFKAAYKGQMELYLRWMEKYEMQPEEETPLGLILCAGKSSEHIELLELEKSGVRVAEYLTELPPRELLERKLHEAIGLARENLAKRGKTEITTEAQRTRRKRTKEKSKKS